MMSNVKFGPAGLGPVKDAVSKLEELHKKGLRACEIAFTYGVYIKEEKDAREIGEKAKELGISLSIHAPYWINLNSEEKEKVEKSKERIINCLKVGTWLGAKRVVFHPGYYSKNSLASFNKSQRKDKKEIKENQEIFDKKKTYDKIKNEILKIQKIRKEKNYTPQLAPETTGKINVFGSVEEIAQLVRDTKCSFCIDFAHILAREKRYRFKETLESLGKGKELHIHFSGIVYGEKGEKHHKKTEKDGWEQLISNLPRDKEITIVCEAPTPSVDAIEGLNIYKSMNNK